MLHWAGAETRRRPSLAQSYPIPELLVEHTDFRTPLRSDFESPGMALAIHSQATQVILTLYKLRKWFYYGWAGNSLFFFLIFFFITLT